MQIESGRSLAHYEIIEPLGKGGMGEVYRAKDTKLGRGVAIKVLPDEFTKDPERLGRFEREARVLASLDHPHIASIHGIEHVDGVRFLVMQLADGEDLARHLARRGPLPVDEAVQIAMHIAEALDAAHDKGIVHRDLKPANVMVDEDGNAKVLDFGLAKAFDSEEVAEELADSPTMVRAATHAGMILGTAAYMSPEQARGRKVDKRADIWAFGVVLWEMLTGKRLFGGETVSDTLASVLKDEPDWSALPPDTPPTIRTVLRLCLEKHPKNRLHDIGDARILIDGNLIGDDHQRVTGSATPSRRVTWAWIAALVLTAALAAGIGGFASRARTSVPEPLQLAIQLHTDQEIMTDGNSLIAFSPDGRSLVFVGRENGRESLFRRDLDTREAVAIPGTDHGEAPFHSPDGAWLGFVANGRLMKIPAEGGRPFALAEARGAGGATWMSDGTIVFAPIYSDGLYRVAVEGGETTQITRPDREAGVLGHWWPDALPDGQHVIFTAFRTPVDQSRIGVANVKTGEVEWLVDGGFFGRYVPTGHLLYAKGRRLFAVPFDSGSRSVTGSPVAAVDDLSVSQTGGFAMFDVSSRGALAYVTHSLGDPPSRLVWIDREGVTTLAIDESRRFLGVDLSPDDRHAAVTVQGESRDLWTYSFERGTLSRLTSGDDTEFDPRWSHDGRELFYIVDRPPFELHRIRVGSPDSGDPIWEERTELDTTSIAVSPDGSHIAFLLTEPETGANIYARPLDGSEPARAVRATRSQEGGPTFSPDGRWIAYWSDETGEQEIYVEPFDSPGQRIQITSDGGTEPVWAGNWEIFYRRFDEIRIVPTRPGERFEFDPPSTLFSASILPSGGDGDRVYDVTRDGQRVLAVNIPPEHQPRQIELVTDWTSELARRVTSQ